MADALPDSVAVALNCPSCGATLHNVSVALRKITCLNCGNKFVPPNTAAPETPVDPGTAVPVVANETAVASESIKLGREPQAAGYWMLRISAMIYGAVVLVIFVVYSLVALNESFRRFSSGWETFRFIGWFALLPFSGWLAVMLTRALSRIEAASLRAGWRKGLIDRALPADPTWSLPYFGPCILGGGVILIASAVEMGRNDYGMIRTPVFTAALVPIAFILLAFVLIDLRQFVFRQIQLALAFSNRTVPRNSMASTNKGLSWAGASILILVSSLIINEYFDREYRYRTWENTWIGFYSIVFLWACAYTLFLLGRAWSESAQHWRRAAQSFPSMGDNALGTRAFICACWSVDGGFFEA